MTTDEVTDISGVNDSPRGDALHVDLTLAILVYSYVSRNGTFLCQQIDYLLVVQLQPGFFLVYKEMVHRPAESEKNSICFSNEYYEFGFFCKLLEKSFYLRNCTMVTYD